MPQIPQTIGNNALSIYSLLKHFDRKRKSILLSNEDKARMGSLAEELIKQNILQKRGFMAYAACIDPECQGNGKVVFIRKIPFVDCASCNQLSKLENEDFEEWEIRLEDLLLHIRNELGLKGEFFELEEKWQLGSYSGIPVIFVGNNNLADPAFSLIKIGYDPHPENKVIGLGEIFAFAFNCGINKSIFEHQKILILAELTDKAEMAPLPPNYSYAGFEIYCQEEPPYLTLSIKFKGKELYGQHKDVRPGEWEVLRSLIMAQGAVVTRTDLSQVLKGTRSDDEMGTEAELDIAIAHLRNQVGINIKTSKKIGYQLLLEQTLQKKS